MKPSSVVEETRGTSFPQIFFFLGEGNSVPPHDIGTKGNGDTVAFPQVGLQKMQSLW